MGHILIRIVLEYYLNLPGWLMDKWGSVLLIKEIRYSCASYVTLQL